MNVLRDGQVDRRGGIAGSSPFNGASSPRMTAAMMGGPVSRAGAGLGAFVLAIVTAGALVHVAVRLKGLEVAYDLGRERRIGTEMEEQQRRLQIEIGMLKDPRRVIAIARDKLKMGPPTADAIWRLGAGRALVDITRSGPNITATTTTATVITTTKATTVGKAGSESKSRAPAGKSERDGKRKP